MFSKIPTYISRLSKGKSNTIAFRAIIRNYFPPAKLIYTDASSLDGRVGIGIYIQNDEQRLAFQLSGILNICQAEMMAINRAAMLALEHKFEL